MSNVVLDERKIDSLVSSYQDTEELLHAGSDAHLDIILQLQTTIKKLIQLSVDVNDQLESSFNDLDKEQATQVVIKLTSGLRLAKQFIHFLRRLDRNTLDGIKSCHKELYLETKQIDEFVQDLIKYKLNEPSELKELLKHI